MDILHERWSGQYAENLSVLTEQEECLPVCLTPGRGRGRSRVDIFSIVTITSLRFELEPVHVVGR
jgi:hypothetical protein